MGVCGVGGDFVHMCICVCVLGMCWMNGGWGSEIKEAVLVDKRKIPKKEQFGAVQVTAGLLTFQAPSIAPVEGSSCC